MNFIRLLTTALFAAATATVAGPIPILFDTDLDTDCDDLGALAMLHTLADRDEVAILATLVSSKLPASAACLDAVNTFYGRPDLPIGVPKGGGASTRRGSRYAAEIAAAFPHDLVAETAADAVGIARGALASAADGSVTVVTVGYLTNLHALLASAPDRHSSLGGRALVAAKVARWVCMGGRYPEHLDPKEYGNFKPDARAAVGAVRDWPTPIVFSGLGEDVLTGERLRDQAPEHHPVRLGYDLYLGEKRERPSWDQVALLFAVEGEGELFSLRRGGRNHIFDNGTNRWEAGPDDPRHLLLESAVSAEALADVIERLMWPG